MFVRRAGQRSHMAVAFILHFVLKKKKSFETCRSSGVSIAAENELLEREKVIHPLNGHPQETAGGKFLAGSGGF